MSSRPEDVALVELVLGPVADAEPDQAAEIAHVLALEGRVEAELEAPEDRRRDHAHDGVEAEGLDVVQVVAGAEAEDERLVEDVLYHQADAGADEHRKRDLEGAVLGADRELLGADIGRHRDERQDRIDDRQPH